MKHIFPLITYFGLLVCFTVSADTNSDLYLPPVIVDLEPEHIEVPLKYDPDYVVFTDSRWERFNFLTSIEFELKQLGYNTFKNYRITGINVSIKSVNSKGQIRLCLYTRKGGCYVVSKFKIDNHKDDFNIKNKWLQIPLYSGAGKEPLPLPFDIEVNGTLKISQISVILESLNPTEPPIINPPHFLAGKNIMHNSGPVMIGESKNLEIFLTNLSMENQNYLFADYRWVEVRVSSNSAVIAKVLVQCLDSAGKEFFISKESDLIAQLTNYYFFAGDSFAFELDRRCSYVKKVVVEGYSPNPVGQRSAIKVNLY